MMLAACLGLLLLVSPTHAELDNHVQAVKAVEEQPSSGLTSLFSGALNALMGHASEDAATKANMSDEKAVGEENKPHFNAAPNDATKNRNLGYETEEHAKFIEQQFAEAQGRAGTNQPCRCEYPGEGLYGPPPNPPAKTKTKSKKKGKGKAGKKKKKGSKSKSKGIIIPGFRYKVVDGKTVIPRWDPYCVNVIFVCPDDRPPVNGVEWTCPGIPPPRPPGKSKSKGKSKKKGKGKGKKKKGKSKSKGVIPGIPGVGPPVIRPNPVYCFLPPDWPVCVRPTKRPTRPPPTPEPPTPEPPTPEPNGRVEGLVFEDLNGNGELDGGEPGIPNVAIVITTSENRRLTVRTDSDGEYSTPVPPGNTNINIVNSSLPSGARQTLGSDPTDVDVPSGGTANDIDGFTVPPPNSCEESGGTIETGICCLSVSDFPNTCVVGACGCSPENSHEIKICSCPGDLCFDGEECVPSPEPPTPEPPTPEPPTPEQPTPEPPTPEQPQPTPDVPPAPDTCINAKIDFDTDGKGRPLSGGTYVTTEWKDPFGMTLSVAKGGCCKEPRLFDTMNVGNDKVAGDSDLGAPNKECPGSGRKPGHGEGGEPDQPGENCDPLGNVLIIQEENWNIDGNKQPDDSADGGEIDFDFDPPLEKLYRIGILDADYEASLYIKYDGGRKTKTINIPLLGDNSKQTVDIDLEKVTFMKLILERSGAVFELDFCYSPPTGPTPEPASPTPEPPTPEAVPEPTNPPPTPDPPTKPDCEYNSLLALVDCAGIGGALVGVTVFGPCDYAFAKFLDDTGFTVDDLCGPKVDELIEILKYHVVDGEILAEDILGSDENMFRLTTLQGSDIKINRDELTVNGNKIVDPDAQKSPFVLHGIDGVLIPPTPEPPSPTPEPPTPEPPAPEPPTREDCEYNSLLALVDCAGIGGALVGVTVFGPCDYAFAKFLDDTGFTVDELCGPNVDELIEVLKYHVVDGEILAEDILGSNVNVFSLKTLQGSKIKINRDRLTVNGNKIVDPDALVPPESAFVLHGIDGVLIPPVQPVPPRPVPPRPQPPGKSKKKGKGKAGMKKKKSKRVRELAVERNMISRRDLSEGAAVIMPSDYKLRLLRGDSFDGGERST